MTGLGFWVAATGLAVAVAVVLGTALRRKDDGAAAPDADLVVYKDQLAEIARDLTRGTLAEGEAARLRTEIGKRILDADRARAAGADQGQSGSGTLALVLIATLALPGALAGYWWLGAPGYPDMALGPRLADLDAGIAARPSQEDALAKADRSRDPGLDAALATELAAISDPAALRLSFQTRFEAGEMQAALRTIQRLQAVLGDTAEANDHALLALTLVAEAGGYVSPEAEVELREALSRDMGNEMARYLVGEMFLQGGRYDQAFRFWRPIADGGSSAPWVAYIREQIEAVAGLAGIPYALPDAVGPSGEDIAAAAEMTAEDRQAMIEGMVAQLSDRLASEGGSVEDWERLIRSLAVLERLPEAQTIYNEAKETFVGMGAELSFLRLAAVETGLNP
ncbi:COG4235 Cytochrome c biogenesis factor [Paracoccaceae bacterium]